MIGHQIKNGVDNRIEIEGKAYELISGPWSIAEEPLLFRHLSELKSGNIDYKPKEDSQGNTWVYRDAKGFKVYDANAGRYIKNNDKPKLSEFRKLQKEIQYAMMRGEWNLTAK